MCEFVGERRDVTFYIRPHVPVRVCVCSTGNSVLVYTHTNVCMRTQRMFVYDFAQRFLLRKQLIAIGPFLSGHVCMFVRSFSIDVDRVRLTNTHARMQTRYIHMSMLSSVCVGFACEFPRYAPRLCECACVIACKQHIVYQPEPLTHWI